ncbi:hypothetical protein PtrSN001A_009326, partial [Pyrenophora tritici-repentis]
MDRYMGLDDACAADFANDYAGIRFWKSLLEVANPQSSVPDPWRSGIAIDPHS